jgi:hypothetical protein
VDQPLPWLKYVKAADLNEDLVDFDGMNVESPTGEHLGDVEGFIVDSDSGRPYYVVVDAGGWFKSKHFLLPAGHATLDSDADGEALVADLTRDRIEKFPGFDLSEFDRMSEADLRRMNDQVCAVCSIDGVVAAVDSSQPYSAAWDRPDFAYPAWWTAPSSSSQPSGGSATATSNAGQPVRTVPGDVSPHFDGRAQPGDVVGIETGGEHTHIGDTDEDENRRRQQAEKAADRDKEPVGSRR